MIGESRLMIDDTPGISIGEMRSKCRKYKLEHGLDIIIIDYLQLMSGSGKSLGIASAGDFGYQPFLKSTRERA